MNKPRNPIDSKTLKKYELARIKAVLEKKPFNTNSPKDYSILKFVGITLGCVIVLSLVIWLV